MEQVFIKPVSGKRVRDPNDGYAIVPDSGLFVVVDSFWQRRLDDGDIMIVDNSVTPDKRDVTDVSKSTTTKKGAK